MADTLYIADPSGAYVMLELVDSTEVGMYMLDIRNTWKKIRYPSSAPGGVYVDANNGAWVKQGVNFPYPKFGVTDAAKPVITIGGINAKEGDYVEIPVTIKNNGWGLSTYWLKFSYDPSMFTFESILFAGSNFRHVTSGHSISTLDISKASSGEIWLKDYGDETSTLNQYNDLTLCYIRGYVATSVPSNVPQIPLHVVGAVGTGIGTEIFLFRDVSGTATLHYIDPVVFTDGFIAVTGHGAPTSTPPSPPSSGTSTGGVAPPTQPPPTPTPTPVPTAQSIDGAGEDFGVVNDGFRFDIWSALAELVGSEFIEVVTDGTDKDARQTFDVGYGEDVGAVTDGVDSGINRRLDDVDISDDVGGFDDSSADTIPPNIDDIRDDFGKVSDGISTDLWKTYDSTVSDTFGDVTDGNGSETGKQLNEVVAADDVGGVIDSTSSDVSKKLADVDVSDDAGGVIDSTSSDVSKKLDDLDVADNVGPTTDGNDN